MTPSIRRQLKEHLEAILDTAAGEELDVIVQMESDRAITSRLAKAAGQAIKRRQMILTPVICCHSPMASEPSRHGKWRE